MLRRSSMKDDESWSSRRLILWSYFLLLNVIGDTGDPGDSFYAIPFLHGSLKRAALLTRFIRIYTFDLVVHGYKDAR